ncbi:MULTISPECIES: sensor histidine kinase [unclassified Saccharothrix]|uniref:sensor histidine kinase n=1 Tax=unclassified Saccharothrix TaxID=2593673 RepID=UPI00307E0A09
MSSSLHPERWPLRTRLIVEQVVLIAVVCAGIGLVTGFALRDFLIGKLDNDLRDTAGRVERAHGFPLPAPMPGMKGPLEGPGFGQGTVVLITYGGAVQDADRLTGRETQVLTSSEQSALMGVPVDAVPHTVALGASGDYRVLSFRARDGARIVTALPMAEVDDIVLRVGLILGGVALAGLIAVSIAGALIIRKTLRPLERVAATASRVAELPLHEGKVALAERVPEQDTDPHTEVGQVGLALNKMLGHVGKALEARHESETRVRQFVADASHELRTPLAAIRGYAELTRRSRDFEVPEQIAHAMRRVESEAVRMTSLVEDLLLLARLDSGRPLSRESVDLSLLVVDAVSDARIAGPDHDWRLELPAEPVVVQGDAHKLQQVLVNLLSNARTHTPSGTTVTTALAVSRGRVSLTVTDDGPGIPVSLQGEVFERFARGDTSRSRAVGSTGLGLSIVAAVVAAHDGKVDVKSSPGKTTFTVTLPH